VTVHPDRGGLYVAIYGPVDFLNRTKIKTMATTCTCCFEDYLVKCDTVIRVNAKLDPNTGYVWIITDKFNREYSGQVETNNDGYFDIPVEDLPAGLLTEYSGNFTLQIQAVNATCGPIRFRMAQEYDCINFTMRAGTHEKNFLGCTFEN
jgi:hypothetical protein